MTPEAEKALRDLDAASVQVRKGLTIRGGGAAAEKRYGAAYMACVRLGVKPTLRSRYR